MPPAVNVALPAIQSDFQATGAEVLWVINAYALFVAALLLAGGAISDRWGRKRVYMGGIALFAVASLRCGLAPSMQMLIAARALHGISALHDSWKSRHDHSNRAASKAQATRLACGRLAAS